MAYNMTIFRQMLNIISRLDFEKIVKKHRGNHRVRTLTCWDQYVHLIFGQFGSRHSLRDIIHSSNSQINKFYHLGSKTVKRSTLADANNKRSYEIYQELFYTFSRTCTKCRAKIQIKIIIKIIYAGHDHNRLKFEIVFMGSFSFKKSRS